MSKTTKRTPIAEQGYLDAIAKKPINNGQCHWGEYRLGYQEGCRETGIEQDWDVFWEAKRQAHLLWLSQAKETIAKGYQSLDEYQASLTEPKF